MRLTFTRRFRKAAHKLPHNTQIRLVKLLETFAENPSHPQLHTKKLSPPLGDYHSFRVGRDFRVLFRIENNSEITLVTIAHRKDVYR